MARKKVLENAVFKEDDATWTFQCPVESGCGVPGQVGFRSTLWPDRKHALDRGAEHFAEHVHGTPMSDLDEFRAARGLIPAPGGGVTVKDLA